MADDTSPTPKWYILKSLLTRYKADDALAMEMDYRHRAGDGRFPVLDYYVPHLEEKRRLVDGTLQDVSSPLGGYVFLRGTLPQVTCFCASNTGFSKIRGLDGDSGFLSIRDEAMESFKLVVRAYNARHENAPFISASPDFFEEGDTVRILDGEFRGVEGMFVTSRGKGRGHVVVKVCHNFYVTTLEVRSSQIQIISFSERNHHVYQQLDSFSPVLFRVAEYFMRNGCLEELDRQLAKDKAKVERFLVRFGAVKIVSDKMRSRITAYILLSLFVLRRQDGVEDANVFPFSHYIDRVREGMGAVTNPVSRAFVNTVLYAATGDVAYQEEAGRAAALWTNGSVRELPLRKREVTAYMELFRRYLRSGISALYGSEGDMAVSLPDRTFTSRLSLAEVLSALPIGYLERISRKLGLDTRCGTTSRSLATDMLGHPEVLRRALRAPSSSSDDEENIRLLDELLASDPDRYIVRKVEGRYFVLQSLGLVATYTHIDNGEWHMLMPGDVRVALAKCTRKESTEDK